MSATTPSRTARLRSALREGVLAPGCYDGLTAALVAEAGFAAAYVSGASIAYSRLGRPDIGLVAMTEVAETVALIADRVDLPLIVDADTGFGNALNVWRTVRVLERAGASAIQLEDQTAPKRCGHLTGKSLVSPEEMIGKIKAALDSRDEALIVARTDAVAVEGFARAIDRAENYLAEGADLIFVEAPRSTAEMAELASRFAGRTSLVANMVEGSGTPSLDYGSLRRMGFRLVIFPGAMTRSVVYAARVLLSTLARDGTTEAYRTNMVDLAGINEAVGTADLLAWGRTYGPALAPAGVSMAKGAG